MNRVLFCALFLFVPALAPACSSPSESSEATTPTGDTPQDVSEPETQPAARPADAGPADTGSVEAAGGGSFKNLQVLPATISKSDLKATMGQVSKSLGVQCDFCHVDDDMASDDNPHKLAARNMMTMTMELNQEFFGGEMVVRCMTCHKGKEHP